MWATSEPCNGNEFTSEKVAACNSNTCVRRVIFYCEFKISFNQEHDTLHVLFLNPMVEDPSFEAHLLMHKTTDTGHGQHNDAVSKRMLLHNEQNG